MTEKRKRGEKGLAGECFLLLRTISYFISEIWLEAPAKNTPLPAPFPTASNSFASLRHGTYQNGFPRPPSNPP